jgi:signal transduction histidine kinase
MMTSHASAQTAVEALRKGAYDYIHKPFELDEVLAVAQRAIEKRRLTLWNHQLVELQSRQNDHLQSLVRRLHSLNAAGIAMSGIASLDELLDFFVGLVEQELDAERVSLMLVTENGEEMRIAASRGLADRVVRETRVRIGEGIAGIVAREGAPLMAAGDAPPEAVKLGGWKGAKGAFVSVPVTLSIPIRTPRVVLGVLNVTNRRSGAPFGDQEMSYLSALAGQAAVAIERARQTDRLVETSRTLSIAEDRLQAFREAMDGAKATSRAKGEFLAKMSQEIRTPLHGLLDFARFGMDEVGSAPTETLKSYFAQIEDSGANLLRLVDELLDLAKLGSGQAVGEFETTDLVDLLEASVGAFQFMCDERKVNLVVAARARPCEIAVDTRRITQVLHNVIGNAVKFARTSIHVALDADPTGDGWRIVVGDDGPGIPLDEREAVFEGFSRSFQARNGAGGSGLGLTISRHLVQMHDGRIWAEDSPLGGAAIHIALPRNGRGVSTGPSHPDASRAA